MTVFIRDRDRCRLCFTLIQREHSILPTSTCCQRSSNLFEKIQRKSSPNKQLTLSHHNKSKQRKVSYHDLVRRYLRTDISSSKTPSSNSICSQCSVSLLDIEQCAKYLKKNVQQLKGKLNKSNQLFTSSLSVKFQKKFISKEKISAENPQMLKTNDEVGEENDDDDDDVDDDEEEFNEIDDEEDSSDDAEGNDQPSALRLTSLYSSVGANSILDKVKKSQNTTKYPCNGNEDDDEDIDDDEDDEEENESLVANVKQAQRTDQRSVSNVDNSLVDSNGNLSDENNPQLAQLRLFQMMANFATASPLTNNISNNVNLSNSTMAALATMQRNFFMELLDDPMTRESVSVNKTNHAANLTEERPALSGGRKRKATPGKRLPRNDGINSTHLSVLNNDENQSKSISDDHPLALIVKNGQQSKDARDQKSNLKNEYHNNKNNGANEQICHSTMTSDQELTVNSTPNDLSMNFSPSLTNRRPTPSKKQRTPISSTQIDAITNFTQQITSNSTNQDDSAGSAMQRQQRKLDPRHCLTCNKVLFSDKTHLIHCQTHAKSEKNCWICGAYDDDIKKHIINEHGNQKITAAGFKCQHCEKSFQIFSDLESHTKEHTKKKPFECHICHKRFGQQGNLSCHLRIHSGVKPFNCSSCGKAFRHSNSLRRHARTVHSVTRSLNSSSNSLLPDTNLSYNHDDKQENFDDVPSALMIPSDDGSSSTGGMPSPSMSNLPMDNDSSEPSGMH